MPNTGNDKQGGLRRVSPVADALPWVLYGVAFSGIAVALVVGAGQVTAALVSARKTLELPVATLTSPTRGPAVYVGLLEGPARRTPSGADAVAWRAWVERGHVDRCGRGEDTNLSLRDAAGAVHVKLADTYVPSPTGHVELLAREPRSMVVWAPRVDAPPEPPAAFLRDCGAEAHWDDPAPSRYVEARLEAGALVKVHGCRVGERIEPCGDYASAVWPASDAPSMTKAIATAREGVQLRLAMAAVAALFVAWQARRTRLGTDARRPR